MVHRTTTSFRLLTPSKIKLKANVKMRSNASIKVFFMLTILLSVLLFSVSSTGSTLSLSPVNPLDQKGITVDFSTFRGAPAKMVYFNNMNRLLLLDANRLVWLSKDSGKSWDKVQSEDAVQVVQHPHAKDTAFIFTGSTTHYQTSNAGDSWTKFETPVAPNSPFIEFNADRLDNYIYYGRKCEPFVIPGFSKCHVKTFYTKDGFRKVEELLEFAVSCTFARSIPTFQQLTPDAIFCVEWKPESSKQYKSAQSIYELQMVYTEDYFRTRKVVDFNGQIDPASTGVFGFGVVQKFLVAVAKPTSADDLDLYVSINGREWAMAKFPLGASLKENAYTVLESTPYSLTVDVLTSSALGTIYSSNSNGTYFTRRLDHTNRRSSEGTVDYERSDIVEGFMLANVVSNWQDFEHPDDGLMKKVQTKASFDNGITWQYLIPPEKDATGNAYECLHQSNQPGDCNLHLHGTTSNLNLGKVFFGKSAPGLVMGVGNVGSYLEPYEEGDVFLSTDGGASWTCVRMGAHMYEMIDSGSIIVLVDDEKPTDYVVYSYNHGRSWENLSLGTTVRAKYTSSDPDALSSSFIITGLIPRNTNVANFSINNSTVAVLGESDAHITNQMMNYQSELSDNQIIKPTQGRRTNSNVVIKIDFSRFFERKCDNNFSNSKDFELWTPKLTDKTEDCIMGRVSGYYRRKSDAACSVSGTKLPTTVHKNCQCTDEDFECDYNYVKDPDTNECKLIGEDVTQPRSCRPGDFYDAPSGYRKIPGNTCTGTHKFENPIKRPCQELDLPPNNDMIQKSITSLPATPIDYIHFENATVAVARLDNKEIWRTPNGGSTWTRILATKGNLIFMGLHEHDRSRIFVLDEKMHMYISSDQGENFEEIQLPAPPSVGQRILDFHPEEWDWILFLGSTDGRTKAYVSIDAGKTWKKPFDEYSEKCLFGEDTMFKTVPKDMIFCSSWEPKTGDQTSPDFQLNKRLQLIAYANLGESKTVLVDKVVNYFVAGGFLAAATEQNGQVDIKISNDGKTFVDAALPDFVKFDKRLFSVVESSMGRIFLNVFKSATTGQQHGVLFASRSDGAHYSVALDNIDINSKLVSFVRLNALDGMILANQLINPDDVLQGSSKKVRTLISRNDGGRFDRIRAPEKTLDGKPFSCVSDCFLNLYLRIARAKLDSAASPGILVGVGNVGSHLGDYETSSTFVSNDAGQSWVMVDTKPNRYQLGAFGGLIVLVDGRKGVSVQNLKYSWNYGEKWEEFKFSEDPVFVQDIYTDETGTINQFVIHVSDSQRNDKFIAIDFSKIYDRPCNFDINLSEKSDFSVWTLEDITGARCLLGRRTKYWRRKETSRCWVTEDRGRLDTDNAPCDCNDDDFECDGNYQRNLSGRCVIIGKDPNRPAECPDGMKYKTHSGYRKIPLSICQKGKNKDKEIEKTCGPHENDPTAEPDVSISEFDHKMADFAYIPESEYIVMLDESGVLYRSWNEGRSWEKVGLAEDHVIVELLINEFLKSHIYFITADDRLIFTKDGAKTFSKLELPLHSNIIGGASLYFHPDDPNWLIFVGSAGCNEYDAFSSCHSEAFYSKDGGENWHSIGTYVKSCQWARSKKFTLVSRTLIFCEKYKYSSGDQREPAGDNPLQLVASDDFFYTSETKLQEIVGASLKGEYMVVAAISEDRQSLNLSTSLDTRRFEYAHFTTELPAKNLGFTVLESHAGSIFLDVMNNMDQGKEFGTLYKSNYNGKYFSRSLDATNRNSRGLVDYEKMQGIEGVLLMNQVSNPEAVKHGQEEKLIVTRMSFDDGATWVPLTSPSTDLKGDKYACQESDCNLHLHSYTEKRDPQNLFDSQSAPGLMLGAGNVGKYLTSYSDSGIFLTRDGGMTWKQITSEAHMFEFGDHGGLIVLVDDEKPTDYVLYSTDEGRTFQKLYFQESNQLIRVTLITTEPESTSMRFLLFGTREETKKPVAIYLDFKGVKDRKCKLDKIDLGASDYELWSPSHNRDSKCLFGHQIQYYRRKPSADCYIGEKYTEPEVIRKDCDCTDADFECDFNYVRSEGVCVLESGVKPEPIPCDGNRHKISSGYRKNPFSTCKNGKQLDQPVVKYCAAGLSGGAWAAIIITPFLFAGVVGLGWIWYRNGGQLNIRMPDIFKRYRYTRVSTSDLGT